MIVLRIQIFRDSLMRHFSRHQENTLLENILSDLNGDGVVLVTGGNGYLAGWMIVGLLRQGFRVRATLRDLAQQAEIRKSIETALYGASDRLTFVKADLLHDEGWTDATSGCRYVMHLASPMGQGASRGRDLVGAARDGTLRVLKAAASAGVERVICTSSAFAAQAHTVSGDAQPVADAGTWTDPGARGIGEYPRSKILAERAAWEFIQNNDSSTALTTILPGLILGPVLTKHLSPSLGLVSGLLTGRFPALPHVGFCLTEAENLVDLHIKAMTNSSAANQRFLATGDFLWFSEIADVLTNAFPEYAAKIPGKRVPNWIMHVSALFSEDAKTMAPMLGKRNEFDSTKTSTLLEWNAVPSKKVLLKCAKSLIDKGLV